MRPILQSEVRFFLWKNLIEIAAALGPRSGGNVKNFNKSRIDRSQCTHCAAMGYVVDKCYKLHGYPPG